jgi:undecaprenyl-diphosphatase
MIKNEIDFYRYIQDVDIKNEMKFISKPFNSLTFLIIILILFLFKILNKRELMIILYGVVFCNVLKMIIKRKRPYKKSKIVLNLSEKNHDTFTNKYSFPSGHTFTSTLLSLILISKYPYNYFYNIIPVLVGFSRIFLGVHYPTDIIGGFVFGFLFFKSSY